MRFVAGLVVVAVTAVIGIAATCIIIAQDSIVKVGDKIQWTVNGSDQWAVPRKVIRIERIKDGTAFVFVLEGTTGIPAAQVRKIT